MSEVVKRLKSSRLLASLRNTDLFQRESSAMNGVEAIVWWEARRIPYHLIVGSTGIVTCVVVGVIAVAAQEFFNSDFGVPDPPVFALFGVILYGILANVCFTAGWIVELFLRRFSPREADRFAISGFFYGVIFSRVANPGSCGSGRRSGNVSPFAPFNRSMNRGFYSLTAMVPRRRGSAKITCVRVVNRIVVP